MRISSGMADQVDSEIVSPFAGDGTPTTEGTWSSTMNHAEGVFGVRSIAPLGG